MTWRGLAPNVRGAIWMLAAACSFTAMSSLVKFLGSDYPPALQAFYRQAAGVIVLFPLMARDWRGTFRTSRFGVLLFRAGVGAAAWILNFYAFQKLPLADANALSFTRTLWLVPLAAFVLHEKVGPWRIAAAIVGFLGVLLMLRSLTQTGHGALGLPQLSALLAALLFAMTITGMKSLTKDHSPFSLLAWSAVLSFAFTLPPALLVWRWPTPMDLLLLFAMGAIATLTQGLYIKGMQVGDAAAMAPIDYTRLVFAVIVGFALFHEVPMPLTLLGAAIVVASTLTITWREYYVARRVHQPPIS